MKRSSLFPSRAFTRSFFITFIIATSFVFSDLPPGSATTLIYKNLSDLATEATKIALVKVTKVEGVHSDKHWTIYTYVTCIASDVVKGTVPLQTPFLLRFEGGSVGKSGLYIPSMPQFQVEEKYILFIRNMHVRRCPIVGWEQGVFRIQQDSQTGREIVLDRLGRKVLAVVGGEVVAKKDTEISPQETPMSPEEFLTAVVGLIPQPSPSVEQGQEDPLILEPEQFPPPKDGAASESL